MSKARDLPVLLTHASQVLATFSISDPPWSAGAENGRFTNPAHRHVRSRREKGTARTNMSTPVAVVSGDDPRDPSAEVKLTLPETWQVESLGECQLTVSLRVCIANNMRMYRPPRFF